MVAKMIEKQISGNVALGGLLLSCILAYYNSGWRAMY